MHTTLRCVSCGEEVMKKEVLLGRAREVDAGHCICARCLPDYGKPRNPAAVKNDRGPWAVISGISVLTIALTMAGLFWLSRSSTKYPPGTTGQSAENATTVSEIMNRVKEEYEEGGADTSVPPIRFPVGERGERIEAYAEMARDGKVDRIRSLLRKAGEDSAKLREILSGIARSERQEFLPAVKPYLSHASLEVRASALLAYGRIGDESSIPEIEPFLEDENPMMRVVAETAINEIKGSGGSDPAAAGP